MQALSVILVAGASARCGPAVPVVHEIVALAGGDSHSLWTYDPDADVWSELPDAPGAIGPGGAMTQFQGPEELYVLRGGGTTDFYRYRMTEGTWTQLAASPDPVTAGGALAAVNFGSGRARLFALQGGGSKSVWQYEIALDQWTTISQLPEQAGDGAGLTVTGAGPSTLLHVLPGASSTVAHQLVVESNAWSTFGNSPVPVRAGGALSHHWENGCEFAFAGGGTTDFFALGPECAVAGSLAAAPAPVLSGGSLAAPPGITRLEMDWVFGTRGGGNTDFWRYSISAHTWVPLAATPGPVSGGGAIVRVRRPTI